MATEIAADTLIAETYRVVRIVGRGGMGEVYEVRHVRTKALLALKVLLADRSPSPQILDRFRREAEIMSSLNHPNVVRVFDSDKLSDGRPFLVMELLEGRELTRLMQPRVPLRPAAVVPLIQQIARGLSAAHAKGIVHRDLKPSNVFLMAGAGGSESVKLLDFGISKVRHESGELTATNSIMGTPHYMSPEQANGRTSEATERADQFALAAIAYEMLSGHRAFPGDEPVAVLYRVVHQQPPDLLSRVPVLPRALEEVVSRGLAKRAEDRFPSVSAFAEAFTTAAGVDDPVRRPPLGALPAQGGHIVQGDTLRSATHLRPSESQRQLARWGRRRTVAVLSATSLAAAFAVAVTAKSHGSRSAVGRGPNPTSLSGVVAEQPTRHPPTTASVLRSSTLAPSTAVERDERVARGVLRAPATKRRKSDIARATSVDTPSTTPKPEDRPVHNEEL